jgi:hypothetical protein
LNCSAPHQYGEIVNHCNHLHFEEDDQFIGGSTAVFRINRMKKQQAAKIHSALQEVSEPVQKLAALKGRDEGCGFPGLKIETWATDMS